MDKQKKKEEMAQDIACSCVDLVESGCGDTPCYVYVLQEKNYRKIPEGAVVIEKSEYEKLRLLADECLDWRRKNCNVGELPKENAVVLTREEYDDLTGGE